jgi:hypothetical protein
VARVLAFGYLIWSAFIGLIAGYATILNCEYGCSRGFPSWLRPWTWGDHYVYPEAFYLGLLGLAAANVFVVLVWVHRPLAAAGVFAASVVLLSYPFFAGLTSSGRVQFALGPVLAIASLAILVWPDQGTRALDPRSER